MITTLIPYLPLLGQGALKTLASWVLAASISLVVGTALGILASRRLGFTRLSYAIRLYTFVMKGVPAYVQILIAYFAIPALLGITISGFFAASFALALCSSGYVTEIVRAGITSLPDGQWDACYVLGYPMTIALRRIVLPQAFRTILPALFGELEQLLKSTSLLAAIGVTELARSGMNIISRELNPVPVYLLIAVIYLLFSAVLTLAMTATERRSQYGTR